MCNLPAISVRHDLRPGDLGEIVRLHGILYAREHGFDETFEAYVAGPMADFVRSRTARERLWIAEQAGRIVGSVAIVDAIGDAAQLRWFLVDPAVRGRGLGRSLLSQAVKFASGQGYRSIFLWTVAQLTAAAKLYSALGFARIESHSTQLWGGTVMEERYVLTL